MNSRIELLGSKTQGNSAIDIGTDHGYLLILLFEKYKFKHLLGIEIAKKPLENFKNNLKKKKYDSFIKYKLSDGFSAIEKNEVQKYDNIIISGMGGETISNILSNSIYKISESQRIILQPNTKIEKLRKFLYENNFEIKCENILKEKNHFYEILIVQKTKETLPYTEDDIYFGKIDFENYIYFEKWFKELNRISSIILNTQDKKIKTEKLLDKNRIIKKIGDKL